MKLSAYIETLQYLHSVHGDVDLIYSEDDEGNGFNTVNCKPSIMRYNEKERDAYSIDEIDVSSLPKVVCVN